MFVYFFILPKFQFSFKPEFQSGNLKTVVKIAPYADLIPNKDLKEKDNGPILIILEKGKKLDESFNLMELINQEEVEEEEKNEVILAVRELRDKDGDIEMNFDEIPYWKEEIINEEEEFKEGTLLILGK